jgi:hypothetical protein
MVHTGDSLEVEFGTTIASGMECEKSLGIDNVTIFYK